MNGRKLYLALPVIILAALLAFAHRGRFFPPREAERTLFAMDTVISITAYGADDAVLDECAAALSRLENDLSVTKESGTIARLNRDKQAELTPDAELLLKEAISVSKMTGGAFDISVRPLVKAWGFTSDERRIPPDAEIERLLKLVDYRKISLENGRAKLGAGMEADLGGIAKGYAGDVLSAILRSAGVSAAVVNLGGNVSCVGAKPDGKSWRIAVKNPAGDGIACILEKGEGHVITSGAYERFFTGEDGKIYGHIIDPGTGRPAGSGLLSVTVAGKNGAMCDALSTAFFVMGAGAAADFWREHGGFELVIITKDRKIFATPGIFPHVVPAGDFASVKVSEIPR